jgi:hypothetical protein
MSQGVKKGKPNELKLTSFKLVCTAFYKLWFEHNWSLSQNLQKNTLV